MATMLLKVSADELREINRSFGGTHEMNTTVDSVFLSARYVSSFWEQVATVVRSIAGGHLFDNGNKRTALAAVTLFQKRNNIFTGALEPQMRETVRLVAIGQLRDVAAIAAGLRGF
jgi:prophage maintenance system killer protein